MGALEFASNEYSTNLQTTINPESVRPYDIVVGASNTQLHLTATTYTNAPAATPYAPYTCEHKKPAVAPLHKMQQVSL